MTHAATSLLPASLSGAHFRSRLRFLAALVAGAVLSSPALAIDYTWTGTTNNTWSIAANWGGTAPVNNASTAVFFGTAASARRAPSITSSVTIGSMTFQVGAGAFTIGRTSANTLTLAAGGSVTNNSTALQTITAPVVLGGASTWNTASGDLAVTGAISGIDSSVTKTGSSILTLTGANTYTGGTTISAGTLRVGTGGQLGTGGVANNGVLAYTGTGTITEANVISGTGSLVQSGTGTTSLTATNTYAGGTTISAGTLQFSSLGNFGSGAVTLNGGSLRWAAGNTADVSGVLALGSSGTLNTNGNDISFANALTGTTALSKAGTGTLTLNAAATGLTSLTVNGGTVRAGAAGVLPSDVAYTVNGTVANGSATLDLNDFDLSIGALTFGGTTAAANTVNSITTGTGTLTLGGNVSYVNASASANHPGAAIISGRLNLGSADRTFTIANSGRTATELTVSADMSGTGGLIKTGLGALSLTGTNTYTGATVISAGALRIASAQSSTNIQFNGGVLELAGDFALTSGTGGGQIRWIGSGGFSAFGGNRTVNLSNGTGLTWGSSNFVASGTALSLSSTASDSTITLADDIDLAGTTQTITTNNGTAAVDAIVSGSLSNGSLTVSGAGVTQLSGANTYTGPTFINGGVLAVATLANGATASTLGASSSDAANLVFAPDSILLYNGTGSSTDRLFQIGTATSGNNTLATIESSGTGAVAFTNTGAITYGLANRTRFLTLSGTNSGDNIFAATVGDNGTGATRIDKEGTGKWTLTGANTHTAVTYVYEGTLSVAHNSALGATTNGVVVLSGATLDLDNVNIGLEGIRISGAGVGGRGSLTSSGTSASAGQIGLEGPAITMGVAGSLELTGELRDFYSNTVITKVGSGTITLSGAGYVGGSDWVLNEGTLVLAKTDSTLAGVYGDVTINNSATLRLAGTTNAQIYYASTITANAGGTFDLAGRSEDFAALAGAGTVTNSAAGGSTMVVGNIDWNPDSTFSGTIQNGLGPLAVGKSGTGTFTVTGANTYTGGTTLTGGTIVAGHDSALGTGVINLNGGSLRGNSARTFANSLRLSNNSTLSGTANLTFTNTLTNINDRTLTVSNTGTTTLGAVNLSNNDTGRTLTIAATGGPVVITGAIANGGTSAGSLVKTDSGTLTLSGASTYTGTTTVSGGSLFIDGDNSAATGAVSVGNTALLGGSGIIGGAVSVASGGTLSPGNSPGQLTLLNGLTMSGTLIMEFAGTSIYDQIDVQGLFTGGGILNLVIIDGFMPTAGNTFLIFNGSTPGFDAGSFQVTTNLAEGLSWDTNSLASTGYVTVVPEPSTWALLAAAGAVLVIFRRRRAA